MSYIKVNVEERKLSHLKLGIPTANIPLEGLEIDGHSDLESGVYYGWAGLDLSGSGTGDLVYPMVMSIGWNPFYKNTVRSVVSTLFILHKFISLTSNVSSGGPHHQSIPA